MKLSKKKVLITGAAGFIGSHLVEALINQGADVKAFVRYNSRNDLGNLSFLSQRLLENMEIIWGDITDEGMVRNAVRGCDCVFHLAALIGIPYSYVAPGSYVNTNIKGTLNVLEAVREFSVSKMVTTSTSECYGTALYEPIDESHPLQGQSPYSASKISADKLAESYYRSFDVPVSTIRPFNTYGPRQSDRAVIPTIIKQLLLKKETIFLGALTPCRDLTFVEDTVDGFIKIAENSDTVGETINIGNGKTISIGALAQKLIDLVNPGVSVVSSEERLRPEKSEVYKLICDNKKAKTVVGWAPKVTLDEGLKKTFQFIKAHRDLYVGDNYTV
ncbi:NAD-dependent dehydratase [Desulfosarcina widdelii]|uniref:NAD-dependent dehydratase n=1 Tax=Desulfosarcina widdelii TaxID=947919 RepID=A0A5K7Z6L9_9BACT|nr:GDP-mannose 4,6-dehydratase [Desulfosarcina widdelii]BBO77652.1 NAD-dependent dehydratase [Desulfosarcina widdelii]